jgi:predicted AAA+ superfamily ATPase
MISSLIKYSVLRLSGTIPAYKRSIHDTIDFDAKMVGLIGARGVGKTTIVLQYLKSLNFHSDEAIYISCDHPVVASNTLFEIAEEFVKYGGKVLVIDEIHKKRDFCIALKNIYDFFDLKIIFTGSSAISLEACQSDLSRRALVYRVPILSLREFIELQTQKSLQSYAIEDILNHHIDIAATLLQEIKPLKAYREYLRYGAYPYFLEGENSYAKRLVEILKESLTYDIATIYNVPIHKIELLDKLLWVLCKSEPYEINYEKISQIIGISKNTLKQYLRYLEKASLINVIGGIARGNSYIKKPDKIYLNNTNLFEVLCKEPKVGTVRETFFVSQMQYRHQLHYPKKGDFLVDEKYLFEIGGAKKRFKQIKDIQNSFVVTDDIEVGFGTKIPLWLFGFLY